MVLTKLSTIFGRCLRDHMVYFRNPASDYRKSDSPKVLQLEGAKLVPELKS